MADGSTKPIGQIVTGDAVEAADSTTGKDVGGRTVQQTFINHDTDLVDVTVKDGSGKLSVLHTTANHPFYDATTNTWVQAGQLVLGHALATTKGQSTPHVDAVKVVAGAADRDNLTVQQLHTYYVVTGAVPVLVHNTDAPCGPTPGLAKLNYYPGIGQSGHFSIEVTNGTDVESMHLMPYEGGIASVSDVPSDMPAPAMTHIFELTNSDAALQYMRDSQGPAGMYNPLSNSCLTFCTKTLAAGGVDAPTDKAAIPWVRHLWRAE